MYSVDVTTVTGSPASPLNHGPLLPSLVDPTMQIVELERLSNLTNNRVYAAEIMARGDGVSQSILFSKTLNWLNRTEQSVHVARSVSDQL